MKTSLQELIEQLKAERHLYMMQEHHPLELAIIEDCFDSAIWKATELLEKEREQRKEEMWKAIVQYQIARKDMSDILKEAPEWFETYYNETFNQNK